MGAGWWGVGGVDHDRDTDFGSLFNQNKASLCAGFHLVQLLFVPGPMSLKTH